MKTITVNWTTEEKTALLVTYRDNDWTWDDVAESVRETNRLIDTVPHIVDVVVDVSATTVLPKGGTSFKVIQEALDTRHYRQGYTVVVGVRGALAMLAKLIERMETQRRGIIHFVDSLDEVFEFLKQVAQERG